MAGRGPSWFGKVSTSTPTGSRNVGKSDSSAVTQADGSLLCFRLPESETALLADMTAENAHADLLTGSEDHELDF